MSAKPASSTSAVGSPVPRSLEERRKREQPVAPGFAGATRDRASRLRRDIDEIGGAAGDGTGLEIETEPEFGEQMQLEPGHQRRRRRRLAEPGDGVVEQVEHRRMGIALRQQPAQCGEMVEAVQSVRRRQERGGTQVDRFDDVIAEMLIEPGTPGCAHPVAGLQHRLEPRAGTAAHETEMAPVPERHQFDDGIGLAMAPSA